MRLIEGEELKQIVIGVWNDIDRYIEGDISLSDIIGIIDDMPTIEPRKKGKWINIREGNRADCDQCGQSGRAWMNFCFDCGADMREPEDIPMEYFENGGR